MHINDLKKHFEHDFPLTHNQREISIWGDFTEFVKNKDGYIFKGEGRVVKLDLDGYIHCDDGPAYQVRGCQYFLQHGKLHCEEHPAIISGEEEVWYIDGIQKNPTGGWTKYFKKAQAYVWLKNGKYHNENGPALISDNKARWIFEGVDMTKGFEKWCKELDSEMDAHAFFIYRFEKSLK